jgi:hypothetical protein
MENSPHWETDSCLADQEIPRPLWNSKIHYRSPQEPPNCILSWRELSQYSVWPQTGRLRFDSRQRQRTFPVASVSRSVLRPTQPPVQWAVGVLSLGKAWSRRDADHSPPSNAEVKKLFSLRLNTAWRVVGHICFCFNSLCPRTLFRTYLRPFLILSPHVCLYLQIGRIIKTIAFWGIAQRNHVVIDRRFMCVYCQHHQGDELVLIIEAVRISETSVYYNDTTRHNILEDCHIQQCTSLHAQLSWTYVPDWTTVHHAPQRKAENPPHTNIVTCQVLDGVSIVT